MERRGFFAGLLGTITGWFSAEGKAEAQDYYDRAHYERLKAKFEPEQTNEPPPTDPSDIPVHLRNRLFVLVQGGSLPGPLTDCLSEKGIEIVQSPATPVSELVEYSKQAGSLYAEPGHVFLKVPTLEQMASRPSDYPRPRPFRVMHSIQAGTIEDLLADYRKKLIQACTAMASVDHIYTEGQLGREQALLCQLIAKQSSGVYEAAPKVSTQSDAWDAMLLRQHRMRHAVDAPDG